METLQNLSDADPDELDQLNNNGYGLARNMGRMSTSNITMDSSLTPRRKTSSSMIMNSFADLAAAQQDEKQEAY